ncbi:MAG: isoleucine--tRNA ligase [Patescibacteria group bacterium]|jgi:isoleucyl-tRNA synthetase|nr:isoleucine--tRNA ligase [Patescibacteria group bacterium]
MEENKQARSPFPVMEEEVLKFWEENKIFEKSVDRVAPQGDYVFYDGPPFATGTPHYGHIAASIMKDSVPRYWTMRGYKVERKWGWDCHGLPIENIVEKELGSKSKKDLDAIGVEKFNNLCRSKVEGYADVWEKTIGRLGRWADMKNSYRTMDLNYMESIWWVFKQLWDRDLVYEGFRSMHVCPRCETTLSQMEVSEGYETIKDLSAIAKFELIDPVIASEAKQSQETADEFNKQGLKERDRHVADTPRDDKIYVLAWTTTPWTLIGNVALAVGNDIDYVKVKITKEENADIFIFAKERLEDTVKENEYEILETFKGSELVGKKYKPLFDYYSKDEKLEGHEKGWAIYAGDFVTTEEGTGAVHIAPAFGDDDMKLGKEHGLPFVQHLGMDGIIKKEATDFAGMNVKEIENHMATDIEIIKYLAHNGLLFHKEKYEHSYPHCWRCETPLLNYATSSWFVSVTKIKDNLLDNAKKINWSPEHIKEGRFGKWLEGARDWSISRQRYWASVMPLWKCECGEIKVFGSIDELEKASGVRVDDLHKDVVDKVKFPCDKCGKEMSRIPDVLDTWFDSGSMPYAQMHYPFENKEKFEANFPAKFIAEGTDQTRAWFYYLHVISGGVKETNAFQNVIVNGIVLAEDGKKMSKRLQNYPDPMEIMNTYGADALRYYFLSSSVMLAENFSFSETGVKEALRKNNMIIWNVYKFYELYASELKDESEKMKVESTNILDKWILSQLNQLIKTVTEEMDSYNLPKSTRPIEEFINDLSTWYIRRSRDRFKSEDIEDKQFALATTKHVLIELSKVMAPFIPFLAETLWQNVSGHDFKDSEKSVHLESWPEAGEIDESLLKEMEEVKRIVELGLAARDEAGIKVRQPLREFKIQNSKFKITKDFENLLADELNVKSIVSKKGEGNITVEFDLEITPELKQEGTKREIVRFVNALRKKADLSIEDRADLSWGSNSEDIKKVFEIFSEDIKKETLCDSMVEGVNDDLDHTKEVKIDGQLVRFGIEKK